MKLNIILITLVTALAAASVHAQAEADAAAQSEIVSRENLWNQAYKSGDTKALDSNIDDAIVLVNDDSSVSQPNAQQQRVAPESLAVHVFGNAAIASGVMRVKGTEKGKSYSRRERFVDTGLKKGGGWVSVCTNATPVLG
jgi:ketosteroid isomerase-like protein